MHFETQKFHHHLNTDLKAVAFCLVKILPLIFNRYTKDQNAFATNVLGLVFFSRGPVAVVLALKPEWEMFRVNVLGFCKIVKVKLSFSVSLKQFWNFRVLNPHSFYCCSCLRVDGN